MALERSVVALARVEGPIVARNSRCCQSRQEWKCGNQMLWSGKEKTNSSYE